MEKIVKGLEFDGEYYYTFGKKFKTKGEVREFYLLTPHGSFDKKALGRVF